jgi:hypothetical protein
MSVARRIAWRITGNEKLDAIRLRAESVTRSFYVHCDGMIASKSDFIRPQFAAYLAKPSRKNEHL